MKKAWILILLTIIFATAIGVMGWNWYSERQRAARFQEELSMAVIVGRVYIVRGTKDWKTISFYDEPAEGVVVELHKAVKEEPSRFGDYALMTTTKVNPEGHYQFKVRPGKYWVNAKIIGFEGVRYFPPTTGFEVRRDEVFVGPTLFFELEE